jgi:hypothetical protein
MKLCTVIVSFGTDSRLRPHAEYTCTRLVLCLHALSYVSASTWPDITIIHLRRRLHQCSCRHLILSFVAGSRLRPNAECTCSRPVLCLPALRFVPRPPGLTSPLSNYFSVSRVARSFSVSIFRSALSVAPSRQPSCVAGFSIGPEDREAIFPATSPPGASPLMPPAMVGGLIFFPTATYEYLIDSHYSITHTLPWLFLSPLSSLLNRYFLVSRTWPFVIK